jgi:hypothetical protein
MVDVRVPGGKPLHIDREFLRQWGLRVWATFAGLILFLQFVRQPQLDGIASGRFGAALLDLVLRIVIAALVALPIAAVITLVAGLIAGRK